MDEERKDLSPTGPGSGDSTPVPSLSGFSSPTTIIAGSSQASRAVNVHNDLCQDRSPSPPIVSAGSSAFQNFSSVFVTDYFDLLYMSRQDVYDPSLAGRLGKLSVKGSRAKQTTPDDNEIKKFMPTPGLSGSGKPHDDGRSGSSAGPSRGSQQRPSLNVPSTRPRRGRSYTSPTVYFTTPTVESYGSLGPSSALVQQQHPQPSHSQSRTHGPPAYPQQGSFVGQYTPPTQPSPQSMYPGQTPYTYAHPIHHPGLRQDAPAMPPPQYPQMGYGSPALVPPVPSRGPIYQYHQRYSPESASPSGSSFPSHASNPAEHVSTSPYNPSPPSGSPIPPPPTVSFTSPHQTAQYPPVHYPPMTTTSSYAPHSFSPSTPSVYQIAPSYSAYIPPASPEDTHPQGGTWWYVPPSTAPTHPSAFDGLQQSYHNIYAMSYSRAGHHGVDAYGNPIPSASFPSSPSHTTGPVSPVSRSPLAPSLHHPQESRGSTSRGTAPPRTPLSPNPGGGGNKPEPGAGDLTSDRGGATQRRSYHPNPPAHRSKWVMWVGNVPSDATQDELWRFFRGELPNPQQTQPLLPAGLLTPESDETEGVLSIFLITRTNCAFVNYSSETHLNEAIQHFNGLQLRPGDPRCPRLLCRVRGEGDDLRAGVGGQRGQGMHRKWVAEQEEREQGKGKESGDKGRKRGSEHPTLTDVEQADEPPATPSDTGRSQSLGLSSDDDLRLQLRSSTKQHSPHHASSSGSYASTTSSFLQRNFPKRYFILKSLSQDDLNISVERGLWATQLHNEGILNQAFRTSTDVYLIFSVNKSGEFFGYAKMAGPIGINDETVSWASRTDSSHSHSPTASLSSAPARTSYANETVPETEGRGQPSRAPKAGTGLIFSPSEHRLSEQSPQPFTAHDVHRAQVIVGGNATSAPLATVSHQHSVAPSGGINTAPGELYDPHKKISMINTGPPPSETFDVGRLREANIIASRKTPRLDPEGPRRAVRDRDPVPLSQDNKTTTSETAARSLGLRQSSAPPETPSGATLRSGEPHERKRGWTGVGVNVHMDPSLSIGQAPSSIEAEAANAEWGTPFKVQWIRVGKLSFNRTRNLRNPWNHDREVKVSRDGTELEPVVGQALLDEWEKMEAEAANVPASVAQGQVLGQPISAGTGRRVGARGLMRTGSSQSEVPASTHHRTQSSHGGGSTSASGTMERGGRGHS